MSYLDIDSRGYYSIHDISPAELRVIQRALIGYNNPIDKKMGTLSRELGMHISSQQNQLINNGPDKISNG